MPYDTQDMSLSGLSGDRTGRQEMVNADPELEARPESVYDALRGSTSSYLFTPTKVFICCNILKYMVVVSNTKTDKLLAWRYITIFVGKDNFHTPIQLPTAGIVVAGNWKTFTITARSDTVASDHHV